MAGDVSEADETWKDAEDQKEVIMCHGSLFSLVFSRLCASVLCIFPFVRIRWRGGVVWMPAAGGVVWLVWFRVSDLVLAHLSVCIPAFVHGGVRGYCAVFLC